MRAAASSNSGMPMFFATTTAPPTTSEWPPEYFVVECTTMSAPWASGLIRYGVATVLSMMRGTPLRCATSAIPEMSRISLFGLEIDSP